MNLDGVNLLVLVEHVNQIFHQCNAREIFGCNSLSVGPGNKWFPLGIVNIIGAMDLGGLEGGAGRESFLLAFACSVTAVAYQHCWLCGRVLLPFHDLVGIWIKKVIASYRHHHESVSLSLWGRSTVAESRTVQRRSMCKCAKGSVAIIAESCDMSCASRMVEFILCRSKSSMGAISSILPWATADLNMRMTRCVKW